MSGIVLITGINGCCTVLARFWMVEVFFKVELGVCQHDELKDALDSVQLTY